MANVYVGLFWMLSISVHVLKGMLAHTFYGHLGSCNKAHFNLKGDLIASCDSTGTIKIWDIRKLTAIISHDFGPYAINDVTFNASSSLLAAASEDKSVKVFNISSHQVNQLS